MPPTRPSLQAQQLQLRANSPFATVEQRQDADQATAKARQAHAAAQNAAQNAQAAAADVARANKPLGTLVDQAPPARRDRDPELAMTVGSGSIGQWPSSTPRP